MIKKIKTLIKKGFDPYIEGKKNFENPKPEIEALAEERVKDCNCLVDEPIFIFQVEDNRIPEISNKICEECGCTAAYKFRQSVDKCKNWKD